MNKSAAVLISTPSLFSGVVGQHSTTMPTPDAVPVDLLAVLAAVPDFAPVRVCARRPPDAGQSRFARCWPVPGLIHDRRVGPRRAHEAIVRMSRG